MLAAPLVWLAARSARRPGLALLLTFAVTTASIAGLSRLRVDSTLSGMLGGGHAAAEALARIVDDFHAAEDLLVVVAVPPSVPDSEARGQLVEFADRLTLAAGTPAASLLGVTGVRYSPDPAIEAYFKEVALPAAALWLDDGAFADLLRRLSPGAVREQLAQNAAMLAAPGPGVSVMASRLLKDPLRLHELFIAEFGIGGRGAGGPEFSDDGRALLIRVSGVRPVNDLEFSKRFTAGVRDLAEQANTSGLELRIGGGYAIAATTASAIRADAISSTISSVLLITAFLALAYRGLAAPLTIGVTAGVGVLTAFGLHAAVATSITPLTAVLAAMLAGLGVDYAIHFRSQYDAARASGLEAAPACAATARELAGPLLAACLTSVFGFGAIALSEVRMLKSFAILGCLGLAGAMLAVWIVLPATLTFASRRETPSRRQNPGPRSTGRRAAALAAARPGLLLSVGAVIGAAALTAIAATPGFAPPFESDPGVMHPRPNPALDTGEFVRERFSSLGDSLLVHVIADSPDQLVARAHEIARRLATPAAAAVGVTGTLGLATLAPDPARTARRMEDLGSLDAEAIVAGVESEIERSEFDAAAYADYVAYLRRLLTIREIPAVDDVLRYPQVARIVLPAASVDAPGVSPRQTVVVVTVERAGPATRTGGDTVEEVRSLVAGAPGATLTGLSVVSRDLGVEARRDLRILGSVSIALVIGWLAAVLRRPTDIVLAFVPVLFSLLCVLGFMSIRGALLNAVNIVAFPLLAGIAVDSGILLVATARRSSPGPAGLLGALGPTLHAITCTAVTTLLGFGSLAWTHTPAVRSLGYAMLVGMMACLSACFLIVIPVLVKRAARTPEGTS